MGFLCPPRPPFHSDNRAPVQSCADPRHTAQKSVQQDRRPIACLHTLEHEAGAPLSFEHKPLQCGEAEGIPRRRKDLRLPCSSVPTQEEHTRCRDSYATGERGCCLLPGSDTLNALHAIDKLTLTRCGQNSDRSSVEANRGWGGSRGGRGETITTKICLPSPKLRSSRYTHNQQNRLRLFETHRLARQKTTQQIHTNRRSPPMTSTLRAPRSSVNQRSSPRCFELCIPQPAIDKLL